MDTIDWYVKKRIPFKYYVQNETLEIHSKAGSYNTFNRDYSIAEINFIKKVKQSVIKNNLQQPYINRYKSERSLNRIRYFQYHPKLKIGAEMRDYVNVDLNSAYWDTANKYGLLLPDIYEEGLTVRKAVRLAAIGALAKKRYAYEFDGKKQTFLGVERTKQTEMLWPLICDHVGKLLCSVMKDSKDHGVFFWVDGIYVKPGVEKKAQQSFKKAGYKCKIVPCENIWTTDRNIWVKCTAKTRIQVVNGQEKEVDTFPFPFRNKEVQKQFEGYSTNL